MYCIHSAYTVEMPTFWFVLISAFVTIVFFKSINVWNIEHYESLWPKPMLRNEFSALEYFVQR